MSKVWSATDARANFAELLNEAAAGQIQQIERRDGATFVLVSKKLFVAARPSLAEYLANLDTGLDEQQSKEWLEAMRDAQGKD
ncbi:MAG: type II toxin-antitoxin system prevent-host-death family antitoxin [Rhodopila sp.]